MDIHEYVVFASKYWPDQDSAATSTLEATDREAEFLNWLTEETDPTCVHGLSEWLCADPITHYPPDHPSMLY